MKLPSVLRYFTDWHGSIHPNPTPDLFTSRLSAIEATTADMSLEAAVGLVSIFLRGDAEQVRSERDGFVQRFSESDRTFPASNNANLVNVMLAGCVAALLDKGGARGVAVALALKAMTMRGKVHQPPQTEVLPAALRLLRAEGARVREEAHDDLAPMPAFAEVVVPAPTPPAVEEVPDGQWPLVAKNDKAIVASLTTLQKTVSALAKATKGLRGETVAAFGVRPTLRDRAVVALQEETQILWWLFGEWSEDGQANFADLKLPGGSMVVGRELALLTRLVPGHPRVGAILGKTLRSHPEGRREASLAEVVSDAKLEWRKAAVAVSKPDRFLTPLLFATERSTEGSSDSWQGTFETVTGVSVGTSALPTEWAEHILDEVLLLRVLADAET